MNAFERRYSQTLMTLGRPLRRADGVPARDIKSTEDRFKITIPDALRAFYRVAGRAVDFTQTRDRFLLPSAWSVEGDYLVFAAENQAVVLYGICLKQSHKADPPVFMSTNHRNLRWYKVCKSVSDFVCVYMLWHGVQGAMRTAGEALATRGAAARLRKGWHYVGEVNKMRAYSQPRRAVCYVKWSDGWRVFIGAQMDEDLIALAKEIGVEPDMVRHSEGDDGVTMIDYQGKTLKLSKWRNKKGEQGWRLEPSER